MEIVLSVLTCIGIMAVFITWAVLRPFVKVQGFAKCLKVTYVYLSDQQERCVYEEIHMPRLSCPNQGLFESTIEIIRPLRWAAANPIDNFLQLGEISIPRSRILSISTDWGEEVIVEGKVQLPVFNRKVFVDDERVFV